jgi:hypothetical protein
MVGNETGIGRFGEDLQEACNRALLEGRKDGVTVTVNQRNGAEVQEPL